MPRTIYIGGRPVQVGNNATERDIRRIANVDRDHFLAEQNPDGEGYEIFDERRSRLPEGRGNLNLIPLPRYKQGFDYRRERILREVSLISQRYPCQIDDYNLNYIAVMQFPLNQYWSQSSTTLLLKIPQDYPKTPPVHFFMRKGGGLSTM